MGLITHETLIITDWKFSAVELLHLRACDIFLSKRVSSIVESAYNGYYTFIIGPDCSKTGPQWEEDIKPYTEARKKFYKEAKALGIKVWKASYGEDMQRPKIYKK